MAVASAQEGDVIDVTEGIEGTAPNHGLHAPSFKIHSFKSGIPKVHWSWSVTIKTQSPYHHLLLFDILTAVKIRVWISWRGSSCTCALTFP